MRSKSAGVLRDRERWLRSLQGCVAAAVHLHVAFNVNVLCFIFSLFYFTFCWLACELIQLGLFVCLFARPYPAADESTFAFYSSHETQTESPEWIQTKRNDTHRNQAVEDYICVKIRDNWTRPNGTPDAGRRTQDTGHRQGRRHRDPDKDPHPQKESPEKGSLIKRENGSEMGPANASYEQCG